MRIHRKVIRIDCWDDLLLPGHRLLAQLVVFGSGEHSKDRIFAIPSKVRVSVLQYCALSYTNFVSYFTVRIYGNTQYCVAGNRGEKIKF